MNWKTARVCLALALCAAVVAGARAQDEKPKEKKKEIKVKLPPAQAKCFKACVDCIKACQAAGKFSNEKVVKDEDKKYITPLRWIFDCGQTCSLAANSLVRQGPAHMAICDLCARVCDGCAKACKGFDDEELKECVKACEACAKACRDMIASHKKEAKGEKKPPEEKAKKEKRDD